jgi:putative sterol carrier protein
VSSIFLEILKKKETQIMAIAPTRISLNGELFSSINQAAKSTKISTRQIKKKIKGFKRS